MNLRPTLARDVPLAGMPFAALL